jgi:membrane protease subunit HflK
MSLNDPQWGRGSNNERPSEPERKPPPQRPGADGPPDLEELWRDLNRKLSELFGKGGKGGRNGEPKRPDARGAGIGIGVLIVVAVLIWLGTGFYLVPEGHRAVVLTFGKATETTTRAGLHWRLPTPIQRHELVNTSEISRVEIGFRGTSGAQRSDDVRREALMLTDDENVVDIQFVVSYRVRDDQAAEFLFTNRNQRDAVKQAAEAAMREVIAGATMDAILSEGATAVAPPNAAKPPAPAPAVPAEAPRAFDEQVRRLMQAILDRYSLGVTVTQVAIVQRRPPEQVLAAFEDVNRAGQDRERFINEGQAYANQVVPEARGTASRLLQQAEGYRSRVVEQAQGDSQRFLSILREHEKAPRVTRDRLYRDAMQDIYSNTGKVLIDTRNANPLLYLPLEQLLKQGGAAATVAPPPAPGSVSNGEPAPAAAGDARARDGQRSREGR